MCMCTCIDKCVYICIWGSPGGSDGKESACNAETWVQSMGQEDPLEKGMATHSSILAWSISWTEEPGGLQSMGVARVRHELVTKSSLLEKPQLDYTDFCWQSDVSAFYV